MSKILILGSNSFSGNQMVNFLIKKKLNVIGCSQSTEPPIQFNIILNNKKKLKKIFVFIKLI